MNVSIFLTHRLANFFETAIIMAASFGLLLFIAWLFAGTTGILLICVAAVPALLIGGAQAGRLVLRMYRAVPLTYRSSPDLTELVEELARRAELPEKPQLFYIPSTAPLAFSVGLGRCGAIALSDGMLRLLSWREIVGVVAHEVSHIAGNDPTVMGVADVASRLVSAVSFAGQMLCGYLGDPQHACSCTPIMIQRYRFRISGPLLDRIDLHIEVPAVKYQDLADSEAIREEHLSEAIQYRSLDRKTT